MRLQIFFDDRIGIGMAVLKVLARHNINMTAGEMLASQDGKGSFYLQAEMDLEQLHAVLPEIRAVPGVRDVRPVPLLPGERKQSELRTLLSALPLPVLSLDLQGKVVVANESAQRLLKLKGPDGQGSAVAALVENLDLVELINRLDGSQYGVRLAIRGQALLADAFPVLVPLSKVGKSLSGAVLVLHGAGAELDDGGIDAAGFRGLVHRSAAMRALVRQAQRMAPLDAPLLICGETGTGKERLAQACHQGGPRREAPFLAMNGADLADAGAERILFGEGEAPGLLERAAGGTLYLGEVADLPAPLQIRLLGFLRDGRFRRVGGLEPWTADVRVIAATREDLQALACEGRLRDELYFQLNALSLRVPPLRERQADILPLALEAIAAACRQLGCAPPRLSAEAEAALLAHAWPGNARELEHALLRAVARADGGTITPEHLDLAGQTTAVSLGDALFEGTLAEALSRLERTMLMRLYPSFPSTRQLARRLGLSHTAVANKLRQYGIAGEPKR